VSEPSYILELFRLAWREDARRFSASLALMVAQAAAAPLSALALGSTVNAVLAADQGGAALAAGLVAVCVLAWLTAGHFAHIYYFELGDRMLVRMQRRLIELSNGSVGLEHHERPDHADKLQVLRQELDRLGSTLVSSLLGAVGLAVAVAITAILLGTLHPQLLWLPLAAVPSLLLGRHAERALASSREAAAQPGRRARHLLQLATEVSTSKELRTCGLEEELRARQAEAWRATSAQLWRGQRRALGLRVLGHVVFASGYVGATLLVVWDAVAVQGSAGSVILAITLAGQVNQQVTGAVTLHHELQRIGRILGDMRWIEAVVRRAPPASPEQAAPAALTQGIVFENVGFSYPEAPAPVLQGVNLRLAAGSTVAIVGENGAGKSTLVKLLCRFYEATSGTIRVDGVDLNRLSVPSWRGQIAAGFQDFVRFELRARETVGVGHLPDVDCDEAVLGALRRARSEGVVSQLDRGLDTELGRSNPGGAELSTGQWQKLALGRAMMRERPLLMVLDEPTSALDALSEHRLFERYAAIARRVGKATGAITLLVSHRFSTVRMADQIVVVADRSIREAGSHQELMRLGGLYAELYSLQARAYQ
jgi:ATP-binding cassette, subfamily B, bacterial